MTAYSIMTVNLQTDMPFYVGDQKFINRAGSIQAMIRYYDPDLIGVQELSEEMLPLLGKLAKTYEFYGRGRNRGNDFANERCCILYRRQRFALQSGETFWLSDTPSEPGTRVAGSVYPRIATAAVLQDLMHPRTFTFCNTHLDHLLPSVRTRQCQALVSRLAEIKKGSFLALTGDFNASSLSVALQTVTALRSPLDLIDAVPLTAGSTLRVIGKARLPIDHILLSSSLHVINVHVIRNMYMGCYPSDHYPVICQFETVDQLV